MTVYYPNCEPVVSPLTMISQVRALPFAGEVLVRVGNRVEPDEVVARTLVPERGRRFPVARQLGISEKDLPGHLLAEDGADVQAGDILVRVGVLRPRVWRCPLAGTLSTAEAEQGYLVVTPPTRTLELQAHLKGFVASVEPYRSVTIQSPASVVQGAFGVGGEQHGVLRVVVTDEGDELQPQILDERSALSILIGGGPVSANALIRALELRVRGVIVGSIPSEELRVFLKYQEDADWAVGASDWSFPPGAAGKSSPLTLVVTEGLGRRPMCRQAFELLTSYDGWEAALDGRTCLHGPELRRPRVIIPLPRADPGEISEQEQSERLSVGAQVRVLSMDYLGLSGKIVAFPRVPRPLACDARYHVAQVRLGDGQVIEVPLENLEMLC